uniref:PEST proteolytic signal-containing nuclear protein n=1 Tax=Schistocephalus solidus TaxID=70667 RepID=A0A0X3Q2J8_SCHSO
MSASETSSYVKEVTSIKRVSPPLKRTFANETDIAKGDSNHPSSVAIASDAPPPKKAASSTEPSNFAISANKPPSRKSKIRITLPTQKPALEPEVKVVPVSSVVKKVFDADEESEEEEMPLEARIKMRNKGRDTPTSCGPNSFGKGRFGFVDQRALADRQTEALAAAVSNDNEKSDRRS